MNQSTRPGGRQKPLFLQVGFCKEWKIRTLAHTDCFHMQLCKEQSWTMISSSFNPLVEQSGDPLSEQGRKNRAICRISQEPTRTSNIRKAFSRNQTEQVDDDDVPSGFLNGTKHQLVKPPKKKILQDSRNSMYYSQEFLKHGIPRNSQEFLGNNSQEFLWNY